MTAQLFLLTNFDKPTATFFKAGYIINKIFLFILNAMICLVESYHWVLDDMSGWCAFWKLLILFFFLLTLFYKNGTFFHAHIFSHNIFSRVLSEKLKTFLWSQKDIFSDTSSSLFTFLTIRFFKANYKKTKQYVVLK